MYLHDSELLRLGPMLVKPFRDEMVQPASIDLTLGPRLLIPTGFAKNVIIDIRQDDPQGYTHQYFNTLEMGASSGYVFKPGESLLAATEEWVTIPDDLAARVEGRSTIGRLFIAVHVTAGWIDPGFSGRVTLELVNNGPFRVTLYPGMPIAQLNVARLVSSAERPYGSVGLGSHYQGQEGAVPAAGRRGVRKGA